LGNKKSITGLGLFGDHDDTRTFRVATPLRCARRMEKKMKLRLGIVAGLIGVTIGCSSYSPSTPSGGTDTAGTPVSIVSHADTLTNTAYAPNPITIGVGATITWTNNDTIAHTSTGDDGSWNSGTIEAGQRFSRTFPAAGTFSYHCTIHPGMVGSVTVR
jgi:plastocyanin